MSNSSFSPTPTNEGGPPVKWRVLQVPGLVPDSIGNYLASIGLLVLAERKWTGIRGCWRCDQFLLVNGPADFTSLVAFLVSIAESNGWSDYGRNWGAEQKADTKAKNTETTGQWRSLEAKELELPLFHSHLALGERLSFNPLFGSGGNAGRRDFATGWKKAVTLLAKAKGKTKEVLEDDLSSFLAGGSCNHLDDYSAGSWFSSANKIYNSGTKRPFRNGQVTPWAMALACESFRLLMGGTSRQLGSYRAATGAFPFVTTAAAPERAGEAGRSIGELWLPIWSRPTSVVEAATLFSRGRAEIRGRGAITAPAFSVAILQRGVDAGITEFRRFALFHTTSENTFESCLAVVVPAMKSADSALAVALDVALDLRDSLPRDWKKGKRWIYAGLRGPLDRVLIELSACPDPAAKRSLVDALVVALRAVDRNRSHRKHNVRFRLLPGAWTDSLVGEHDEITPEIRLAYAIASIRPSHTIPPSRNSEITAPILAYWLGAENQGNWWAIPERVPLRRVWGAGEFAANIGAILRRRLVEERPDADPPFDGRLHVGLADIESLLLRQLDEAELTRWFFRFSLFSGQGASSLAWAQRLRPGRRIEVVSPSTALFALFKPMFDGRLIRHGSIGASRTVKVGTLSRIAALLFRSDVSSAVEAARNAYHAVGVELGDFDCQFEAQNPSHLLASLMTPVRNNEVAQAFGRWRLPAKSKSRKETQT